MESSSLISKLPLIRYADKEIKNIEVRGCKKGNLLKRLRARGTPPQPRSKKSTSKLSIIQEQVKCMPKLVCAPRKQSEKYSYNPRH